MKARRRAEEQYRNQKAQTEAQKAILLKKKRQILECQEQIQRMDRYAERAVIEGQEEKAYRYLEQKQIWQERLVEMMQAAGITLEGVPTAQESSHEEEQETEPGTDGCQISEASN